MVNRISDHKFQLKILHQEWISTEELDLFSHGEIHLSVNGTTITTGEQKGISESALALLRTCQQNYFLDLE